MWVAKSTSLLSIVTLTNCAEPLTHFQNQIKTKIVKFGSCQEKTENEPYFNKYLFIYLSINLNLRRLCHKFVYASLLITI